MKRFWKDVAVERTEGGWRIALDGRPLRTQGGQAQVVPSAALAEVLAGEWREAGEKFEPADFPNRDLADFAIDKVRADRQAAIAALLAYAETDTLCFRADPGDALFDHQQQLWEPLLTACETRHAIRFERVSGVILRPHPPQTLERLQAALEELDEFALAALTAMASLAASLVVALAALEPGADAATLFSAANAEEDWQAGQWGWDAEAEKTRAARLEAFGLAARFAQAARERQAGA